MRRKFSCILAAVLVLGLLPLTMNPQEPEKRYQLFYVIDEAVKPSMEEAYYEAAKNWTTFMKEHEYPYPCNSYWTADNHVYWAFPIKSYAGIDKIREAINKVKEKSPDQFKAATDAFKGTYESQLSSVYALDYKLSMIAKEEKTESEEEENFTFFDIYYFEPGNEAELDKIFEEMKAYMADKEVVQSWYFYWGMIGTETPVLWSAAAAKNPQEFWEENAKAWKVWGKEGGKIKQKMMKYVTRQEQKMAWYQKELSYTPAKKEK
jgi:hypothetical protein